MKRVLIALALVAASAAPALADYGKEPTMRRHQAAVSTYERHAEMRMRGMPDLQRANDPYWSPCDYNSNTPIINSCFLSCPRWVGLVPSLSFTPGNRCGSSLRSGRSG